MPRPGGAEPRGHKTHRQAVVLAREPDYNPRV
jgi:hypothetical protein